MSIAGPNTLYQTTSFSFVITKTYKIFAINTTNPEIRTFILHFIINGWRSSSLVISVFFIVIEHFHIIVMLDKHRFFHHSIQQTKRKQVEQIHRLVLLFRYYIPIQEDKKSQQLPCEVYGNAFQMFFHHALIVYLRWIIFTDISSRKVKEPENWVSNLF